MRPKLILHNLESTFFFLLPSFLKCQIQLSHSRGKYTYPFKIRIVELTSFMNIIQCWQGCEELIAHFREMSNQEEYCYELSGRQSDTMYQNVYL